MNDPFMANRPLGRVQVWSLKANFVDGEVQPIRTLNAHTGRICQVQKKQPPFQSNNSIIQSTD